MSGARTLAIHTGALGDFLLACPAIARLGEAGPVVLAGSPERHALAVAAGIAERALPLDALALHEVFSGQEARRFREAVRGFDRAVVWMRDADGRLEEAFHAAGIDNITCAAGLPHSDWQGHAAAYYCASAGVPENPDFRLKVPPVEGLDVVIAPGSGGAKKNWPIENFHALAEAVERRGRQVTWLLGPAEDAFTLPNEAETLRSPPLTALAGQLAAARLYIGNDSGPTHLAGLVGCPTLAIFGPTKPKTWAPLGAQAGVLHAPPVWPPVECVIAEVSGMLSS